MSEPFHRADWRRLFGAYAISVVGTLLANGVVGWVAVTELEASGTQLGLLLAGASIAAAITGIVLGGRIDGWSKRRVVIRTDLVAAVAIASLLLARAADQVSLVHLGVVAGVELAAGVVITAATAPLLKVAAGPQLDWAMARQESVLWLSWMIAPALGGTFTALVGPSVVWSANAVSFLMAAMLLRSVSVDPISASKQPGRRSSGLTTIWRLRTLRWLYLNATLYGLAVMASTPVVTFLMLHDLGLSAWQQGLVLGVPTVGGLLASMVVNRLQDGLGHRRLLLASGVARTLWILPLAAVPIGLASVPTLVGLQLGMLFCAGLFNPTFSATRIRLAPSERLSAVQATWSATNRIAQPIGMLGAGLLLDALGSRTALVIAGALCLASGLLLLPLGRDRQLEGFSRTSCHMPPTRQYGSRSQSSSSRASSSAK